MKKEQILAYLKMNQEEFSKKYQISKIAVFGSYAKDNATDQSDIDIAIETKLSDYFLLYDFKETLKRDFQTKVDVVRLRENMNPFFKKQILKEGIYV